MARHGISGMYIGPFELSPDRQDALNPVPASNIAGLNTHDLPPFAAWWEGLDLVDRQELGLLDEAMVHTEREGRLERERALVAALQYAGRLDGLPVPPSVTLEPPEAPSEAAPCDPAAVARWETARAVLGAWLEQLAASPARIVLLNSEDLWLETRPQNVPGTWQERPNWRQKIRYPLDAWDSLPGLRDTVAAVDRLRAAPPAAAGEQKEPL
jgi:4-alpha-glucanotransferase